MPPSKSKAFQHPKRENYRLALNCLTSTLSTTNPTPFYVADFTNKYEVPGLFAVLDEMDFVSRGAGLLVTMSAGLYNVTPEQAIAWTERANKPLQKADEFFENCKELAKGSSTSRTLKVPVSDKMLDDAISKLKINSTIERDGHDIILKHSVERIKQLEESDISPKAEQRIREFMNSAPLQPKPLATAYEIRIVHHSLNLEMDVMTTEDADIIDAILFKLNRNPDAVL